MQTPREAAAPAVTAVDAGERMPRRIKGLLLGLFFFALLPIITDTARFHGDERFYTDAAITMVQSGDFWTPRWPDGGIRLLKPIVTYWAAAASFKIFGISLFSARVLFLLAGVAILVVTFQLGKTMFRSERIAFLAALMLGSNIQLWTVSTRSTPDVLLCLFVSLSVLGFARFWFANDRSWTTSILICGGMGLAVQTKGLLGLCPLLANVVFWIAARPRRVGLGGTIRWPAVLGGMALALFWYGVMLQRHGWGSLQDFYSDQVGSRLTWSVGFMLGNFWTYLFAGVRHFLPWTLLLLASVVWFRKGLADFWRHRRAECLFLLCLFVPLVFIFGLGNIRRSRYLIASYPMLAVLIAALLAEVSRKEAVTRWVGIGIRVLSGIAATVGIALLGIGSPIHWRLGLAGGMLLAVGVAPWLWRRRFHGMVPWIWVGMVGLVGFVSFGSCVRPVFSPSPLVQIAARVPQLDPGLSTLHTWRVPPTDASRLRLLTHGEFKINAVSTNSMTLDQVPGKVVLTTAGARGQLAAAGFDLVPIENRNEHLEGSALGRRALRLAEKSRTHAIPSFWIGMRRVTPGGTSAQ